MILPQPHDPRFITLRRGGTPSNPDHHLLALWAVACAPAHQLGALPATAATGPNEAKGPTGVAGPLHEHATSSKGRVSREG